ncbi:MAG: response regulator [Victivallaceae bacterium]|nr:response regulator [Victivallaceae bacterium]
MIFILIAGASYTFWSVRSEDHSMRDELLVKARALAVTINPELVIPFKGEENDRFLPQHLRLKHEFELLHQAEPELRYIYLLSLKDDGTILFLLDNEPFGSPDYIPPGTVYGEATAALKNGIRNGTEVVEGPEEDRWGIWFSAIVPIFDPHSGKMVCAFGIDMAAADWNYRLFMAGLPGMVMTILLAAIIMITRCLHGYPGITKTGGRFRFFDVGVTITIGILLSAFIFWQIYESELKQRRSFFDQLAATQVESITRKLSYSDFNELEGLGNFFAASDDVTEDEFRAYSEHLKNKSYVDLWGWVDVVGASEMADYEREESKRLHHDFRIYEIGPDGRPRPAEGRNFYYPIRFCSPDAGNGPPLGFDMGSDRGYLDAIFEAIRTKLETAGIAVGAGLHGGGSIRELAIFYPVFTRGNTRLLRGLSIAFIDMDSLLGFNPNKLKYFHMGLSYLKYDGDSDLLIARTGDDTCHLGNSFSGFILAFGHVFELTAHPSNAFLHDYPIWKPWLFLVCGLALTAAFATIVNLLHRRRERLESMVEEGAVKLGKEETRFDQLLEESKTVLWECDADGVFINFRPSGKPVYGLPREDVIGKFRWYDFCPEEKLDALKSEVMRIMDSRRAFFNLENEVKLADGSIVVVSSCGIPVFADDGTFKGYYGWDSDITGYVELTNRLRQSQREAEAANRAKSEFLTNMSHEIRTPINGIIGFIDLLRASDVNPAQRNEYLELINSCSRQLMLLVNEILDYARTTAGKLVRADEAFDLRKLIEEAACSIALSAEGKQLEVIASVPQDIPAGLVGDAAHLLQIIMNLAGNAVKFTEKGEVVIGVGREAEDEQTITLRFFVRDTGIGFDEKQKQRIFEKFFQADSSTRRRYGGVGLGLPIVKNVVTLLGGTIDVHSKPGCGSEFSFVITLGKQPGGAGSFEPDSACAALSPVLVAVGNAAARDELIARLRYHRLEVVGAADIASAVEARRRSREDGNPFRLLVLDLDMLGPEEAGMNSASEHELLTGIPVVGLAGVIARSLLSPVVTKLVSQVVSKPVRNHELFIALKRIATGDNRDEEGMNTCGSAVPMPADGGAAEILVAEDNPVNQKVMIAILERLGRRAEVVPNGVQVLQRLADNNYRLVLMDVQMPGMDGLDATRMIRDPKTQVLNHDIPIIAVTAHAVYGYEEKCREYGMDGYIAKPVTMSQLKEILDRWLT